jgi:hypothetical protein
MLNIRANDQHLALALNPKSIRSAGVIEPLTGDFGFHIVDGGEVFARIFDLQKFKLGPHPVQLYRKVLRLQRNLKDFPQIADGLAPAERENRDFLLGIIRRSEKGETLDVIPMKVSERDVELLLVVSDREHVSTEIAEPRPGVNNGDTIYIHQSDLKAGGVAAELLEASIADWDGAAGTVKFYLHAELYRRIGGSGKDGVKGRAEKAGKVGDRPLKS